MEHTWNSIQAIPGSFLESAPSEFVRTLRREMERRGLTQERFPNFAFRDWVSGASHILVVQMLMPMNDWTMHVEAQRQPDLLNIHYRAELYASKAGGKLNRWLHEGVRTRWTVGIVTLAVLACLVAPGLLCAILCPAWIAAAAYEEYFSRLSTKQGYIWIQRQGEVEELTGRFQGALDVALTSARSGTLTAPAESRHRATPSGEPSSVPFEVE